MNTYVNDIKRIIFRLKIHAITEKTSLLSTVYTAIYSNATL